MFRTGFVGRQFPSGLGAGTATGTMQSLDLNFLSGALDSRITLARAGATATYFNSAGTLQVASANAPRFDYDPVSLQIKGLLLEEGRINLNTFSQAINSWTTKTDTTVTDNNAVSPDGTTNASLCTEGTAGTANVVCPTATVASGATVTGTAFVKRGNNDWLRIIVADPTLTNGVQCWVNTSTGALGTTSVRGTGTSPVASIQTIRNGWYRVTLTGTLPGGTTTVAIAVNSASADNSATKVNNATYLLWGVQLEQNGFATSYIPTSGATATRNADNTTMPLASWFNAAAGTFDAEFIPQQAAATATQGGVLRWDDTTNNNDGVLFVNTSGNMLAAGAVATVLQINATLGNPTFGAINKAAITYGGALWTGHINAATVQNGSGGAVPSGMNRLIIGGSNVTSSNWILNGWIRRIKYWPRALGASEMLAEDGQPTLDIGFVDPAGGIDSRLTITRASIATYIDSSRTIQQVSNNVARFDHDIATGTPLGLLIEENRVQLLTNSQTGWNASNAVVSTDLPALFSGANVLKVTWPNVNANGPNFVNVSVSSSFSYALSCYMWIPSSYNSALDGPPQIDADIGSLGSGGTSVTGRADLSKRDQWQRVTTIMNLGTGASATANLVVRRNTIGGLGGQSFYVTCPQFELGTFPTSYVPSTSGIVSRQADNISTPLGPWFVSSQGTLIVDALFGTIPTTSFPRYAEFSDGGIASNYNALSFSPGTSQQAIMAISSAAAATSTVTFTPIVNIPFKVGLTYTTTAHQVCANGGTPSSQSNTGVPNSLIVLQLGNRPAMDRHLNGYVRRLRYFPRVLSNAELAQATT
jgi:hypothetical protein